MVEQIFKRLANSAVDTALTAFWTAIGGVVLAAIYSIWAYASGHRGRLLTISMSMFAAYVTVIAVAALRIFATTNVLLIGAALGLLLVALYKIVSRRKMERRRLEGHGKGVYDFLEEGKEQEAALLKILTKLTSETERIGAQSRAASSTFSTVKDDPARAKRVLDKAARSFRDSAKSYKAHAERMRVALDKYWDAHEGVIDWLKSTGHTPQVEEYKNLIAGFVDQLVASLNSTRGMRDSITGLPQMSRNLNASLAELVTSIEVAITALEENLHRLRKALAGL